MYYKSKAITLGIWAITALAISRLFFAFVKDPEGPNLLVVAGLGAILFCMAIGAYAFSSFKSGMQTLLFGIFAQAVIAAIVYFAFIP